MPPKKHQNKGSANGKPANKSSQKPTNQVDNANGNGGITSASIVAGLTGFVLLGLLVVFLSWLQELLEKFSLGHSAFVFCFLTFVAAMIGIGWLLVEIFPRFKRITIGGTVASCIGFAVFLYFNKGAFDSTNPVKSRSFTLLSTNEGQPESSLAVFPYAYPHPDQPIQTDFVLENKGLFGIRDITCDFFIKKLEYSDGSVFERIGGDYGVQAINLHPSQQTTLRSSRFVNLVNSNMKTKYADLEITVHFADERTPTNEQSRVFEFFTKQLENGQVIWYPLGN